MHKQLDVLRGDWDVAVAYRLTPDQECHGTATSQTKWVLDGRFLRQEYHSQMQGRPFVVVQYLGYDSQRSKFLEVKMDSMDNSIGLHEGTASPDGKVFQAEGETLDPTTRRPMKLRTVTTIHDPDHYTLEWFFVSEGKAQKRVTLTHTRRTP